jgi:hypothetical protein
LPHNLVQTAETVLEVFGRERLLTFDTDSVEITHEALLRAWPRLHGWITADRVGLRIHQQLSEAADMWEQSERDSSILYRGSQLAVAHDWAIDLGRTDQLSDSEAAFLDASAAQEKHERQAQRRRSQIFAVLVALAVVAGSIAGYQYIDQRNQSLLTIATISRPNRAHLPQHNQIPRCALLSKPSTRPTRQMRAARC